LEHSYSFFIELIIELWHGALVSDGDIHRDIRRFLDPVFNLFPVQNLGVLVNISFTMWQRWCMDAENV